MTHYISVQVEKDIFKHFEVPEEVSIYIKQLEAYIRYPKESKLLELYKNRFKMRTE